MKQAWGEVKCPGSHIQSMCHKSGTCRYSGLPGTTSEKLEEGPQARTQGPTQHSSATPGAARSSALMADGALLRDQVLLRSTQLKGKEDPGSWQGASSWALLP